MLRDYFTFALAAVFILSAILPAYAYTTSTAPSYQFVKIPSFSMSVSSPSAVMLPGNENSITLTISSINSFSGNVALSANAPSGIIVTIPSSVSVSSGGSTNVNISIIASLDTPGGTYSVTINGQNGSISQSTTISVMVQSFSMSASTNSMSILAGGSSSTTITISSINSFGGTVKFSYSHPPTGITLQYSSPSVSVSPSFSPAVTVTISVLSSVPPGTYLINFFGESGVINQGTDLSITVTPPPSAPVIQTPTVGSKVISPVAISGTAPPSSQVIFSDSNGASYSTTADTSGQWSFTETLAPGPDTISVTDTVSGVTSAATTVSIIVQSTTSTPSSSTSTPSSSTSTPSSSTSTPSSSTSTPSQPTPPIISAPTSGATVTNPVTIYGVAPPGSTVNFDSNSVSDTTTADPSTGQWSFTETLAPGPDAIAVTDTVGGATSAATTSSITVRSISSSPPPTSSIPSSTSSTTPNPPAAPTSSSSLSTSPSSGAITITTGSGNDQSCVSAQNCFSPNVLSVSQGTTVTWTNQDTAPHAVESGQQTDPQAGTVFNSGPIKSGQTFSYTFNTAGTFPYFDGIDPWMTGTITVTSQSQTTSNPSPYNQQSPGAPKAQSFTQSPDVITGFLSGNSITITNQNTNSQVTNYVTVQSVPDNYAQKVLGISGQYVTTVAFQDRYGRPESNNNLNVFLQISHTAGKVNSMRGVELGGDQILAGFTSSGNAPITLVNSAEIAIPQGSAQNIPQKVRDTLNPAVEPAQTPQPILDFLNNNIDLVNKVTGDHLAHYILVQTVPDLYAQKVLGISGQYVTTLAFEDRYGREDSNGNLNVFLQISHTDIQVNSIRGVQLGGDDVEAFVNGVDEGTITKTVEIPTSP